MPYYSLDVSFFEGLEFWILYSTSRFQDSNSTELVLNPQSPKYTILKTAKLTAIYSIFIFDSMQLGKSYLWI